MTQLRTEQETVQGIALKALKNEVSLAAQLLRQLREARETMELECDVIAAARDVFRHATECLEKLPTIGPDDMFEVQRLMDEFRLALADIGE